MARIAIPTVVKPAAPLVSDLPPRIRKEGKYWKAIRVLGFHGYVPDASLDVPEGTPSMTWEGGCITNALWSQILAFFEWSQKEFKSEAQVRLYYNRATNRWAAWAYPQRPSGMTTNEIADHPDVAAQRAQFPEPWLLLGTVHHHCTMAAFQSGTDRTNEGDQEGIHITVGNIGSEEYSIHGRVVVRNTTYGAEWSDWFELPEVAAALPVKLHSKLLDFYIKQPPAEDTAFPEQWKKNCIKPEPVTSVGFRGGMDYSGSHGSQPRVLSIVRTDLRAQFTPVEIKWMEEVVNILDQEKISQTALDFIICSGVDMPTGKDRLIQAEVIARATKYGIIRVRVDELLDKWDFETVCNELAAVPTMLTSPVENGRPTQPAGQGLTNVK